MRFFIALLLFIVVVLGGIQAYSLHTQESVLAKKDRELETQANALVLENQIFARDIEYFKNDTNLTKELQSKVNYRKPDEKMFMLLPVSPSQDGSQE